MPKLTHEQFVLAALEKLRDPRYKGLHVVYSGFNDAFREYFPNDDPRKVLTGLQERGVIVVRPARGGAVVYPPGEHRPTGSDALNKILGRRKTR